MSAQICRARQDVYANPTCLLCPMGNSFLGNHGVHHLLNGVSGRAGRGQRDQMCSDKLYPNSQLGINSILTCCCYSRGKHQILSLNEPLSLKLSLQPGFSCFLLFH